MPPRRRRRRKTYTFWGWFLGICSEALLFLLSTLSDACELPPPFEAMEPKDAPKAYYEVGEKIEYKCKRGYLYLFPFLMIATCEPNHTWFPVSDDGCAKVECTILEDPPFGKVHYVDGRATWGSRAQFTCEEGYYLVGTSVLHCLLKGDDDAFWNGPSPHCEKIYCLPPPKISNGTHTFTDIEVFKYKEAVIYSCDPFPGPDKFSLVGRSMLFCSGQNTWSSKPPECKEPKYSTFTGLENKGYLVLQEDGTVQLQALKSDQKHEDSERDFSLEREIPLNLSKCLSFQACMEHLQVVSCPYPLLENGRQISGFATKFSYQAKVSFECTEGFYMQGRDTVMCSANNTWEPSIPECLKGPKPTHPRKPPVYNHPGYPNPREGIFGQELDAWIVALIIITSLVGVVVICLIILRYIEYRKKQKSEIIIQHAPFRKKSSSSVSETKATSRTRPRGSNISEASNASPEK